MSCSDRIAFPVVPNFAGVQAQEQIFIATSREPDHDGQFGRGRGETNRFLNVNVSIPATHVPGKIEQGYANPDPARHFTISSRQDYGNSQQFLSNLRKSVNARKSGDREITIYVHGYNNSFADGVFRMAQLTHDLQQPGVAVHYSWPSAMNPLGYTYDRDSVLLARDGLEELVRLVRSAGSDRVLLVGHSMGTLLIMETLRQIDISDPDWASRNLSGVLMFSPDIDIDVFKAQARRIRKLPQPFIIFTSKRDRALGLSARLNGSRDRLGELGDPAELKEFPVTLIDITEFGSGAGHFTAGSSPALISILSNTAALEQAFRGDRSGRSGLFPGTVITVQNATQLILSPVLAP